MPYKDNILIFYLAASEAMWTENNGKRQLPTLLDNIYVVLIHNKTHPKFAAYNKDRFGWTYVIEFNNIYYENVQFLSMWTVFANIQENKSCVNKIY